MGINQSGVRKYQLDWKFTSRLVNEHLGRNKYSSSAKAICELIANAFDADADSVNVVVRTNALGGVSAVVIKDNGRGISPDDIKKRFAVVGVDSTGSVKSNAQFGRFGVGRLALFRIGTFGKWVTVSEPQKGKRVRSTLLMKEGDKLKVEEEEASDSVPLGTAIEIYNVRDTGQQSLTTARLSSEILTQFCSYLLGNPSRKLSVQGELLDINDLIGHREVDAIVPSAELPHEATINHLLLNTPVERSRFPSHLIFAAKGRTVANSDLDDAPSANYLGLVECPYLDSIVASNREAIIEMDEVFANLKAIALTRVKAFGDKYRSERKRHFIERARQEDFYPYRDSAPSAVAQVHQALYDVVLEKVHEHANLENMTKRQQEVVFRLLQRSLENENVLEVLHEVAKLSDTDMEKFREVLEHTTLDSIVKLSSEVTSRLTFLDILHELVYGEEAKKLKERTQLHRILEPHCWLFGPQFHLATSDRSFRKVVKKHRELAGLDPTITDLNGLEGGRKIPDLFLAATRDYPVNPKQYHVLVELKAPGVKLGRKEVEQIRKYAEIILESSEFDKTATRWDLFLVSAHATSEIKRDREQKDKPHGCLWDWPNMTVWAFEWSEIISNARNEMQLVREHLQRKSSELTISDYLQKNFPEILGDATANDLGIK
jgi:hypothetical protein